MATATGGAPAPCRPSWSPLFQLEPLPDWALAPDGRHLRDVPPAEFRRLVARLGIPGLDLTAGHVRLAKQYIEHLRGIYDSAGHAAVTAWLAERHAS